MMIVRAFDTEITRDGRNLAGIALRWNEINSVTDDGQKFYRESFTNGSVTKTLKERGAIPLPLGYSHPWFEGSNGYADEEYRDTQLGTVRFRAAEEGLIFESRLFDTKQANKIKEERIDTGDLRGVSVGFHPYQSKQVDDHIIRTEIGLLELSLAESPQHKGAEITLVRDEITTLSRDDLLRALRRLDLTTIRP